MSSTRIYIDTEFNGHGGELISFAAVTDDQNWYGEFPLPDLSLIHPWVKANVLPMLYKSFIQKKTALVLQQEFHVWLANFDNPEIICDWHADAAHFCQLLEGPDYGTRLDFPCRITILKTPPGQPVSQRPHNAYYDALALRDWHQGVLRNAA